MYYRKLRGAMAERGILQDDLGNCIGLSRACISHRFNRVTPWSLPEAYAVLGFMRIPANEIGAYFPPDGMEAQQ